MPQLSRFSRPGIPLPLTRELGEGHGFSRAATDSPDFVIPSRPQPRLRRGRARNLQFKMATQNCRSLAPLGMTILYKSRRRLPQLSCFSRPGIPLPLEPCGSSREAAQECSPEPARAKPRGRKPWVRVSNEGQAPQGRQKLLPDIPFVVGNLVLLQKGDIFLLERHLLVMFFLVGDIPGNGRKPLKFAFAGVCNRQEKEPIIPALLITTPLRFFVLVLNLLPATNFQRLQHASYRTFANLKNSCFPFPRLVGIFHR